MKILPLQDKNILVTGASSGIGKATSILFSELGANVFITARGEDTLSETFKDLKSSENHFKINADLTHIQDIKLLAKSLPGSIDGIAHCCGKIMPVPVKFIKESQLQDIFSVNYFSAVHLISELLVQKKINNNSSIVFISSVSTLHAYFGGAPYISSKAALEGYAKTLALELAPKKIRVNVLQPALVKTSIFENTINGVSSSSKADDLIDSYPFGIGEPIDVAQALAFFISDNSKWITGSCLKMDGGLTLGFK